MMAIANDIHFCYQNIKTKMNW